MKRLTAINDPAFERVATEFSSWRQTRNNRGRIPSRLWNAAAALCRKHSLNQVALGLKINHTKLKQYYTKGKALQRKPAISSTGFIELCPQQATPSEYFIEMENIVGSIMKVHLKGSKDNTLFQLAQDFWNQQ